MHYANTGKHRKVLAAFVYGYDEVFYNMDNSIKVILIVFLLCLIALAVVFVFNRKGGNPLITDGEYNKAVITAERKSIAFSNDEDIEQIVTVLSEIRVSATPVSETGAGNKSGDKIFVTLTKSDESTLDFCFNSSFTLCRIGDTKWYKVKNPGKAKAIYTIFCNAKER